MHDPLAIISQCDQAALARIMSDPKEWVETFLVHPMTQEPFKANHTQQLVFASKEKWNTLRVYRRGGKTSAMTALCLYYALTTASCQCLMAAPHGSHVSRFFNELRDFIRENSWIGEYMTTSTVNPQFIKFSNGSTIAGFTTGAKNKGEALSIRGQGGDILFLDEAGYLGDGDWQALKPIIKGNF